MEDLELALSELKLCSKTEANENRLENAIDTFLQTLDKDGTDRKVLTQKLIDDGILKELAYLLEEEGKSLSKVEQLIAELAKTELARKPCVDANLIPNLVNHLCSQDLDTALQACRALGNICYDNDFGRNAVNDSQGTEKLVQLLKDHLDNPAEGADRLRVISCGFLLNLTNTHEPTQERAVQAGVIDVLSMYLQKYGNDEDLCIMALMSLNCIAETEVGRCKIADKDIAKIVVDLVDIDTSPDILDTILELLGNLAENDEVKFQLAVAGLCERLLDMLKSPQNKNEDDCITLEKVACDLIVLLLTGDESMEYLYQGGQSQVFKETIDWLQSNNENLRIAGALAIGNFARNDDHCIHMVMEGITNQLLSLLQTNDGKEGDIRLQHAILSALRNLAIPAANKPVMLESGILDAVLPLVSVDMYPVIFKLLGMLRMLIDGQAAAAVKLGMNTPFMDLVIEWCSTEDHAGVRGEANRLLAWLIKHSKSTDVMKAVVKGGGIPHLVNMATSEHAVMQNEALLALTLITSAILETSVPVLRNSEFVPTVCKLLTDENCNPEIQCNVLSLIHAGLASDVLMSDMKAAGLNEIITHLNDHSNQMLSDRARAISEQFGTG